MSRALAFERVVVSAERELHGFGVLQRKISRPSSFIEQNSYLNASSSNTASRFFRPRRTRFHGDGIFISRSG